jgi:hypothetical protein
MARVCAHQLRPGDVLLGVLSGRPWRVVRSIEKVTNYDADPESGRAINIDAVPIGTVGDYYQPIEVAASAQIDILREEESR